MTIASRTISEYVVIDPDFSILLQALKKADLADLSMGKVILLSLHLTIMLSRPFLMKLAFQGLMT